MRRLFTTSRQRAAGLQSPELKNPGRELFLFRRRLMIAGSVMIVAFAGLLGRFVYLQLVLIWSGWLAILMWRRSALPA